MNSAARLFLNSLMKEKAEVVRTIRLVSCTKA